MIISQTPYRVSFAGGGTDLPAFCDREDGAVLSVAIRKHMYVTVRPRFDATTRVAYTQTEIVNSVDDLKHTIVRAALKMMEMDGHIGITTYGDVPSGTGMGSSSSLAVGLINALRAYRGSITSPAALAQLACHIEIDTLGKPIGRQDQHAAAYGGVNYMTFRAGGRVDVEPVPCRVHALAKLEEWALLLYTDQQRNADTVLKKQAAVTVDKMPTLREMRDLAASMRIALCSGEIGHFADLLHHGWVLKRSLGCGISTAIVDNWYTKARRAGARGGKLLGAGGGGFLLLLAPPDCHSAIRGALGSPQELEFSIDPRGSRIIFISDRQ